MKVAVMQPYFFPYLGYFQMIAAVDAFIVWDDVQYIQRGWVNRNRILLNGEPVYITLPLEKAPLTANIDERRIADINSAKNKIMGQLQSAYRKAPYYAETRALVEAVLSIPDSQLAAFLFHSLQIICKHLEVEENLILSSSMPKDKTIVGGTPRIIDICKSLQAEMYVNASGGRELYRASDFLEQGIALRFMAMNSIEYDQGLMDFVPHLSIIDVLMFNGREATRELLQQYTLQP